VRKNSIGEQELALLRPVAPSQGMMLESLRPDLAAHRGSPSLSSWTCGRSFRSSPQIGALSNKIVASE